MSDIPDDIETRKHWFTFFEDAAARGAVEEELTLPEIAEDIRFTTRSAKSKLPWIKLARFGDRLSPKGSLRHNANVEAISGIEIDHDKGTMTFDQAVELLQAAGLRSIVYTSPSHAAGQERWRVLAPTSALYPPEKRREFTAIVNGVLRGAAADESFSLSQSYYYGSVQSNPDHRVEVLDGDFVDLRLDLFSGQIGKSGKSAKSGHTRKTAGEQEQATPAYTAAEVKALLEKSQQHGEWYQAMRSVTGTLVARGWNDDRIFTLTAGYAWEGYGDSDVVKLIGDARAKWGIPDMPEDLSERVGAALDELASDLGEHEIPFDVPNWRERNQGGSPRASFHNAILAIEAAQLTCTQDTFHKRTMLGRSAAARPSAPAPSFCGVVTDEAISGLRTLLSNAFGFDLTEKHVRDAVVEIARVNQFNPVVDMLAEAEASWDGVERLDRMAVDHFNAEDTPLNRAMVRKTMIGAVKRARQPGCKFDTILTLESPEGWNKSSAFALLAGEGNFSDEPIIGHATREVQEQLAGIWIHENAELAGMRKAEVETIKTFASRQTDRARPAYGHFLVEQPRQSIEVGSTNDRRYLPSQTGNRRFWPLRLLRPIDLGLLRAARLQLWGEAARYQSAGESVVLPEALWLAAGAEQEARRLRHPWEELIPERMMSPQYATYVEKFPDLVRVTTADLLEHVLKVPPADMQRHYRALADVMRMLGWEACEVKRAGTNLTSKGYRKKVQ